MGRKYKVTVMSKQAGILVRMRKEFQKGLGEAICALKPERLRAKLATIWAKKTLAKRSGAETLRQKPLWHHLGQRSWQAWTAQDGEPGRQLDSVLSEGKSQGGKGRTETGVLPECR